MQNILGYPVDDTTRVVMSALTKVYVGEVAEAGASELAPPPTSPLLAAPRPPRLPPLTLLPLCSA